MAEWTFTLGGIPPSGVESYSLTTARGLQLTMRVDGVADAQFVLDGSSPEAAQLVPFATDLHIYRDTTKMFRGRIGTVVDTISETTHTVQCSASDYRAHLRRRIIEPAGRAFTALTAQATIAWTLINESQALPGGSMGITNGTHAGTNTTRVATFNAGDPIGDKIEELGRLDAGFEWEISPTLVFNTWGPKRGASTGAVLDYGGNVASCSRILDPDDFANRVIAIGDQSLIPRSDTAAAIGSDPRGRWERSHSFPGVSIGATLAAKADWLLAISNVVRPEWTVTLTPATWRGLTHIGLGDTVSLNVRSGRLAESANHRVVEIRANIDESGIETVALGLVPA